MNEIKKVLVTGGAGFIGSFVVDNLKQRGIDVTVFDRFPREKYVRSDINVFLGDVRDENSTIEAIAMHDGVIHLAATLGTQETVSNPKPVVESNILGSLNVFKALTLHPKPAVYIAVGNYWMNNPYSITKTAAERFALMYNKEQKTRIAVVRGLNVFGPRQKAKPVKKLVPNLIIPALHNEDIVIYGDGEQIMDMIYVEDIAEILIRALIQDHGVYDRVFQAGRGEKTTVNEVATTVVRLTRSSSKILHQPMRPGENEGAIVKANPDEWNLEKLGWKKNMFTSLDEGLQKSIAYLMQHPEEH